MRETDRRRPWRTTAAAALAASLLFGGAACGTAPAETRAATRGGTAPVAATGPVRQGEVTRRLRDLETAYKGRIGAFAVDTGTGRVVGHRAHERFPFLSTFKALAAAAVLHKARTQDPGLMERVVHWTEQEEKPNSPKTKGQGGPDKGMTVAQLCDAAIRYSDNTAGNMLLKQLGGPAGYTRHLRSLGDPVSRLDRWEIELNDWKPGERNDTTTPANMGADLREVTAGGALVPADRARLVGWLRANTTGDARIRAGLPHWTVGDKTGSADARANDVAVAWPPGAAAPVIIAVYTYRHDLTAPREDKVIADTAAVLARGLGLAP
ncbi:class A beta-lactamase [Actinomadura macrotermitis]|uniref:Beta-lactamase n=1 Tax=Actinomadura macrotermitis TaxID=2585200 RepID=A0A7K0BM15_9ACTN|nr:class A beta-lactamase [Actinomadura macrotermitis]MQY02215.1 Beta-lactamase AST-1 [Actinomadura macrotermitis]